MRQAPSLPDLGQADVPDEAGLDHLRDRTDGLPDRHLPIEPGGTQEVHVVGAKPRQRLRERVLRRGGTRVVSDEAAAGFALGAEL